MRDVETWMGGGFGLVSTSVDDRCNVVECCGEGKDCEVGDSSELVDDFVDGKDTADGSCSVSMTSSGAMEELTLVHQSNQE